jgi:predicted DCC family thiol-disulfide oxidoreductase YuxK
MPAADRRPLTSVGRLTVVYDDRCALRRRCRGSLSTQEQLVPLDFVAASDSAVRGWAGSMIPVGDELVVMDNNGSVWVGPDAFIVCLWALRSYRRLSTRLASPAMKPVAKQVFHRLSAGRGMVSALFPRDGFPRDGFPRDGFPRDGFPRDAALDSPQFDGEICGDSCNR